MIDKSKRAVILANGPLPDPEAARQYIQTGDWLICADGGTRHALTLGLTPDVVIGDMDSLEPHIKKELESQGVRFEVHPVDKDQTDLELALELAVSAGVRQIDLLAVQGGRLDQSLANLLLLTRPAWSQAQVRAIVESEIVWAVRGGQQAEINGAPGDRVSLVPLAHQVIGVTLTGVRWPLDEATLELGSTWSISNVLTEPTAHLWVGEGVLLVVHKQ